MSNNKQNSNSNDEHHHHGHEHKKRKLVGSANFVRHNPMTDKFKIHKFDHVEYYCQDATNFSQRFIWGFGMRPVSKSDLSTGNSTYNSVVLTSGEIKFVFTAPYGNKIDKTNSQTPNPYYKPNEATEMINKHGLFVRAIGIRVDDAVAAFNIATANGADIAMPPTCFKDHKANTSVWFSEIKFVDDVVIRFVSGNYTGEFHPSYAPVQSPNINYGFTRMDHMVTNVWKLLDTVKWLEECLGFHEFAEFTAEDVGTIDSGLNSMVMSSNNEMVLIPINEPTYGTNRKSQIQTYLEHNEGPGVQHIALKTDDIFATMEELRKRTLCGGFAFMPKPSDNYYKQLPLKFGKDLSAEQYKRIEELGLLADKDEEGILLQIFTKPLADRSTIFIEIIQRIGCNVKNPQTQVVEQKAGCGGFGKGNFSELFKSIEDFEKEIDKAAGRMY